MRAVALISAALALILTGPAQGQVMARGYYNHIEDRISFYIPGLTRADQVKIEEASSTTQDGLSHKGRKHSHEAGGVRHAVTSIDFREAYEKSHWIMQGSMATVAAQYRQLGKVTLDEFGRTDRIPAHYLNIALPNGRLLYVLLILHQDDDMDQRRLVIAEAETPPRARQPGLFLASIGIINPKYFGTAADHTLWRVRYSPAGPPIHGTELVATQPWGIGEYQENMSAGGEAIPDN